MKPIDRHAPASRISSAIERWKRGLGVTALVAIMVLAAMIPAALIGWLSSYLGADEYLVGILALCVTAPWMLSQPEVLRSIGRITDTKN
ncbi:hypothetical protein Q9K01_10925 [Qipengyuania sp. DY56-A-20]|uniref:Uncharacterized protein n=1 Tax=Qipengyuania benthica TaxID=3067651 RepID=A0ABT9H9Y7_9SPHN|nr:hypothetical protein [Qipengyuania sp. DY56-A-20]MDP4540140.1 hypothetical protein [Qipengyuania sp. DY56-A-20]